MAYIGSSLPAEGRRGGIGSLEDDAAVGANHPVFHVKNDVQQLVAILGRIFGIRSKATSEAQASDTTYLQLIDVVADDAILHGDDHLFVIVVLMLDPISIVTFPIFEFVYVVISRSSGFTFHESLEVLCACYTTECSFFIL